MESSVNQLDAVLQGIDGGGGGGGGAAEEAAAPADPLAELYSSIAAASSSLAAASADGPAASGAAAAGGEAGAAGAAGAATAADLDAVELPPGLRRTKLPAPWLEYQDPGTGHSYFVNPHTGASQWARPG